MVYGFGSESSKSRSGFLRSSGSPRLPDSWSCASNRNLSSSYSSSLMCLQNSEIYNVHFWYNSDFTTIKKMADYSYMKIVPPRAKHFGWQWLLELTTHPRFHSRAKMNYGCWTFQRKSRAHIHFQHLTDHCPSRWGQFQCFRGNNSLFQRHIRCSFKVLVISLHPERLCNVHLLALVQSVSASSILPVSSRSFLRLPRDFSRLSATLGCLVKAAF